MRVGISAAARERLSTLISAGKHPARQLTKARILLKADVSDAGEGWSDSKIAIALDTSIDTVARTRQQLVEEGLEAVLLRKHSPASARQRIRRITLTPTNERHSMKPFRRRSAPAG
jgi:transposase